MTVSYSCREQDQIQTKQMSLPDYNSLIPDDILKTFMSDMAGSLFNTESSKLTDDHILSSIDFHAENLYIEKNMSSEIVNAFKMYQSVHSENTRLSNEQSQIQSDFVTEFHVRFNNSQSIEDYRESISVLLYEFNERDLSEGDVIFISNFLVVMELYFELSSVLYEDGSSSNERTQYHQLHCNWWCSTKKFLSDVGDCAGQTLETIASDAVYSAATVAATAATGGAAAAYGLAGIAIGCTINVATR